MMSIYLVGRDNYIHCIQSYTLFIHCEVRCDTQNPLEGNMMPYHHTSSSNQEKAVGQQIVTHCVTLSLHFRERHSHCEIGEIRIV